VETLVAKLILSGNVLPQSKVIIDAGENGLSARSEKSVG
jgi:hypothetical protein